ncbi:MAG: tRNA pseudouridine(55) synthase TruB [Acidobacteria bacterium]|nr:tRNA pseudouridine(55) synthase TruB [Acidobacteriota bacterium]
MQIQNPKSKIQNVIDGILIVDKPIGLTSHDVVARLRRILKTKRIGHTGTLDPFATGVLVMLVGKATRLAQFLDRDAKEYEAVIRFGFETDTGDGTGRRKAKGEGRKAEELKIEEIENVLASFRGEIEQTPPMYSAKKVDGKKLYELARKGAEIERKPVKVSIYELEIIEQQRTQRNTEKEIIDQKPKTEDYALRVACSAGTYVRTLAEDIGKKIGVGAHLAQLRRTKAGKFDLSKAVTIEELEEIVAAAKLNDILISMNEAVAHLPKIALNAEEIKNTQNGKRLNFERIEIENNQAIRMIDAAENLIAIGFYLKQEKSIQPKLVLI